jgi:hypothetical protein
MGKKTIFRLRSKAQQYRDLSASEVDARLRAALVDTADDFEQEAADAESDLIHGTAESDPTA